MRKLIALIMIASCVVFARTRSESWNVYNYTVAANKSVTANILNSGFAIQSDSSSLNIYLRQTPASLSINYITIQPNTYRDFYPLNWVSGSYIIIDPVQTTSSVQVIIYNNKE